MSCFEVRQDERKTKARSHGGITVTNGSTIEFRMEYRMKRWRGLRGFVAGCVITACLWLTTAAQTAKPQAPESKAAATTADYSGMYMFLKEGEFVQVTVEDQGHVTGFVSRYGDGDSDKGAFLDQFFKSGKLEGNRLTFTTEVVHGVWFDFKGTVERGEGKSPGDEGYYVLKGTVTENSSDVDKKVNSRARNVVLKMFPQSAGPAPAARN